MAATVRRAVSSFTDVVFPPTPYQDMKYRDAVKPGNDYVSSLPLQMALYFNLFFYPLWLVSSIVMLVAKYESLSSLYRFIIIAILVMMTLVEATRLYLGYIGNLTEQVPELAGFWMLTILLQLPLILFLLTNTHAIILPLESAVNIVLTFFVLFEVLVGYFAIRSMVQYQVTKFHLQQFTNLQPVDMEPTPLNSARHMKAAKMA